MNIADDGKEKAKILMIDDDQGFCRIYKSLLEETDRYSVTTAHSGEEGLMLARKQRYDVILLDILMPEMGGGEVACLLSCNELTRDVPYIFITSVIAPHENNTDNQHFYLGKPIDPEYLASAIEKVIANGHLNPVHLQAFTKESQLRGLLSICASCKKIRNDEGRWEQIEQYIRKRSDVNFSHGICPDCVKKLYPEFYEKNMEKRKD